MSVRTCICDPSMPPPTVTDYLTFCTAWDCVRWEAVHAISERVDAYRPPPLEPEPKPETKQKPKPETRPAFAQQEVVQEQLL